MMPDHIISATAANRAFSDILNKVHYQHQSFEIKRGKEIIAKIVPAAPTKKGLKVKELNALFKQIPSLKKKRIVKILSKLFMNCDNT